ncbi:hypothetical protein CA11_33710 [Gimesia maris]|uniref:hypothetical protein n=1 Tax=Gimesia maris TaxID=122 RepID=UPI001189989D|nr:hypothetical protein [Gimesia maris]QDU15545.1 hypothetical protein CA11_33710 [Gimesia maris]
MYRLSALLMLLLPALVQAAPHEIIHVVNPHHVTRAEYLADLRANSSLTDDQIDDRYREFLQDRERSQRGLILKLRVLIKKYRLKGIYLQGLSEKNHQATLDYLESLKQYEKTNTINESEFEKRKKDQNRLDLSELGAAGQLVITGELQTILPAEDAKAFEAVNSVKSDGSIKFVEKEEHERENAIVRNLMKADGVAVIVLSRDHNLADNLKELGFSCRYVMMGSSPPVESNIDTFKKSIFKRGDKLTGNRLK